MQRFYKEFVCGIVGFVDEGMAEVLNGRIYLASMPSYFVFEINLDQPLVFQNSFCKPNVFFGA